MAAATRLAEALTRLERKDTDVVLLDLNLPDSEGLATFLQLKQAMPDLAAAAVAQPDL